MSQSICTVHSVSTLATTSHDGYSRSARSHSSRRNHIQKRSLWRRYCRCRLATPRRGCLFRSTASITAGTIPGRATLKRGRRSSRFAPSTSLHCVSCILTPCSLESPFFVQEWRSSGIRGVWLKVPIHLVACVPKAVDKVSLSLPLSPDPCHQTTASCCWTLFDCPPWLHGTHTDVHMGKITAPCRASSSITQRRTMSC